MPVNELRIFLKENHILLLEYDVQTSETASYISIYTENGRSHLESAILFSIRVRKDVFVNCITGEAQDTGFDTASQSWPKRHPFRDFLQPSHPSGFSL